MTDHTLDAGLSYGQPYPAAAHPQPTRTARTWDREAITLIAVSVLLGLVILAPITLSMQDLVDWAAAPRGLALTGPWPYLVPIALDGAAAACIGMVIVKTWRSERPGWFGKLVWVFAAASAYAQYSHGIAARDAGGAQDAWWALPALALLGPLLLERVLHTVRGWIRKDSGAVMQGAAGFGARWIPGVAFLSTLRAWAASRRWGIAQASDAIQFVEDVDAVKAMSGAEAMRYAFGALRVNDPHAARVWLGRRNKRVSQSDVDAATAGLPLVPRPVSAVPYPTSGAGGGAEGEGHEVRLASFQFNRDRIRYALAALAAMGQPRDGKAVMDWLLGYGYKVDRMDAYRLAQQAAAIEAGAS